MIKKISLLCGICLCILVSCVKIDESHTYKNEFLHHLRSISESDLDSGSFTLSTNLYWDVIVLADTFLLEGFLSNELGMDVDQFQTISKTLNSMDLDNEAKLIFIKNEKVVAVEDIDLMENDASMESNFRYILIKKVSPTIYFKKISGQIRLYGSDKRSQEILEEETPEEFNQRQLALYRGKGEKLDYQSQSPYPDVTTPKLLMKTFFKARKEQNEAVLRECLFPEKRADIFLRKGRPEDSGSVRLVEIQELETPVPIMYKSDIKATHKVIVTQHETWITKELVDVPYFYYLRKINNKWKILSWTLALDYGS